MQILKEVEPTTCFNPLGVESTNKWGAKDNPKVSGLKDV